MKLTSVEIHPNGSSDFAVFSFRDPSSTNVFNIKSILGLDADEIVSRYYAGSTGKFYNLSLQKREIVFKIGLNPNFESFQTYSDLRDRLYKMIASSRTGKVQIKFLNGETAVAAISGFISKFESPLFEKTQEIQVTVICDDPFLKALTPVNVDLTGVTPYPLTIIQDDLSTAPHGFKFEMEITANIADLYVFDPDDFSWVFYIVPSGGFLDNDILHFSSEHNDKYLYLVRGVTTIQLADAIYPNSVWPLIFPGTNKFRARSIASTDIVEWDSITYYPTYWGV